MALKAIPVHKCLEKRLHIFGFEITELFILALLLSLLSTVFGSFNAKISLIWFPTATTALILKISKRGKPENFLFHWIRHQLRPSYLSAFSEPNTIPERRRFSNV